MTKEPPRYTRSMPSGAHLLLKLFLFRKQTNLFEHYVCIDYVGNGWRYTSQERESRPRARWLDDIKTVTTCTLTELSNAKSISNETSFRLADGLPNDGYLSANGLHLNYRGTNRLATNLGLAAAGQEVQRAKTRTNRNQGDRISTRQNERSQCQQTDNEWHTVRRYRNDDRRDTTRFNKIAIQGTPQMAVD